jgi:hypothetical protein
MLLTDLLHLCTNLFRPPATTVRTAERKLLIVPLHAAVDKPQMQPVIAAAADELASSGKLFKWLRTDGNPKLCRWDSTQMQFVRGSVEDWAVYFGQHWRVRDTNNIEYAGPSFVVADRLIAAVLAHPQTPVASWQTAIDLKRKAARCR